jgi:hypothetical protein
MYSSILRRATQLTARLCLVGAMAGSAAHAIVTGSFAFDGNGTQVTVSLASLTFAGGNDTKVTTTGLTYGAGILLPLGNLGNIQNIGSSFPIDFFMTENGTPLDFKLLGLGPGDLVDPHDCSTATSNGQSCSLLLNSPPFPANTVSPVILTFNNNTTNAVVHMNGTVTDGSGITSFWTGQLSATLTAPLDQITSNPQAGSVAPTPQNIAAYFAANPNGDVITSFSGTITASAVPEPDSAMLLGAGLMVLSFSVRRLRKVQRK